MPAGSALSHLYPRELCAQQVGSLRSHSRCPLTPLFPLMVETGGSLRIVPDDFCNSVVWPLTPHAAIPCAYDPCSVNPVRTGPEVISRSGALHVRRRLFTCSFRSAVTCSVPANLWVLFSRNAWLDSGYRFLVNSWLLSWFHEEIHVLLSGV